MGTIRSLRALFAVDDAVFRECRDCGAKFDEARAECLVCGSGEIATYEL